MPTTNAGRIFHRVLDSAGIAKENELGEVLTIHCLRHTCNSWLARRGVPVEIRQRILGHSDAKLTSEVYTHLDVEDLRRAIEAKVNTEPEQQAKEAR